MPYFVSVDSNMRVSNVYNDEMMDAGVLKYAISDADFSMISGVENLGDFVITEGGLAYSKIKSKSDYENAIQAMHDKAAQNRGYDDINSCAKYLGYENPFRAECEALCGWAAQCWAMCYELIGKVEKGDIAEPTIEEAISMLPELSL